MFNLDSQLIYEGIESGVNAVAGCSDRYLTLPAHRYAHELAAKIAALNPSLVHADPRQATAQNLGHQAVLILCCVGSQVEDGYFEVPGLVGLIAAEPRQYFRKANGKVGIVQLP